jgi:putative peptidoglycan lipid II flippase
MAIAVLVGGIFQFALCWAVVRQAGVKLHFRRPSSHRGPRAGRADPPPPRRPASIRLAQLFYAYFSAGLAKARSTKLSYADRLNQLPLSIIGSRAWRRHPAGDQPAIARGRMPRRPTSRPAPSTCRCCSPCRPRWLVVAAGPIIGALYQGGDHSVADAAVTGNILAILVTGLPAYVLVKVLTPAFYARKDVKTPVWIAMSVLLGGIVANFILIPIMGIYSLATVTSASAWINFALLFIILYARNQFRMPGWLIARWALLSSGRGSGAATAGAEAGAGEAVV